MSYVAIFEYNNGWDIDHSVKEVNSIEEALEFNKPCIETDRNPYGDSYIVLFLIPTEKWGKVKIWKNQIKELVSLYGKEIIKEEYEPVGSISNRVADQFRVRLHINQWNGINKNMLSGIVIEKTFY